MLKRLAACSSLSFIIASSCAHGAAFSVACRTWFSLVWTDYTESVSFDESFPRFSLYYIDESVVVLRADDGSGMTVVIQDEQVIFDGSVEFSECEVTITSTEMDVVSPSHVDALVERIEELERRVTALEN